MTTEHARFSVVVPAYNAEETLAETLDAVLAQSFLDWECVVVDDGSADRTADVAAAFAVKDARIRLVSQENRGTGGAYNTGVRNAAGEWVTLCSADDVLLPEHLEVMAEVIDSRPDFDIVTCNGCYWYPDGSRTRVYPAGTEDHERSWSLSELMEKCFFSVGAIYRRSLFDEVGGYLEDVFGEDYDFWLRAMAAGARHLYIPQVLSLHRVTATQKSANVVRAYESDIRSISGVVESGRLDAGELRAARKAIAYRRQLISEVTQPGRLSNRLRNLARSALGRPTR